MIVGKQINYQYQSRTGKRIVRIGNGSEQGQIKLRGLGVVSVAADPMHATAIICPWRWSWSGSWLLH